MTCTFLQISALHGMDMDPKSTRGEQWGRGPDGKLSVQPDSGFVFVLEDFGLAHYRIAFDVCALPKRYGVGTCHIDSVQKSETRDKSYGGH